MNATQTAKNQNTEKKFRELKKQQQQQCFIIMLPVLPVKNDLNQPKIV